MERSRGSRIWSAGLWRPGWVVVGLIGLLGPLHAEQPLTDRQTRVEKMTPAEKEELARRQQRFARLNQTEKQRLRELDRQLASDAHADELRQVMHRYYQWVTTLPPYERNALLEMPPKERLKRVRELLEEQDRKAKRPRPGPLPSADRARRWLEFGSPGPATAKRVTEEDLKSLHAWLEHYLVGHESAILQRLPETQRQKVRELLQSAKDSPRRRTILATAWLQLQMQRPSAAPPLGDKEAGELFDRLAPELQQRLEGVAPPERRRVVLTWLRLAAGYDVFQNPEPSLPLVEEDELARFFEMQLEPRDQDRLLALPGEEMQRELLLVYLRFRLAEERSRPAPRAQGKREAGSPPTQPGRTPSPKSAAK